MINGVVLLKLRRAVGVEKKSWVLLANSTFVPVVTVISPVTIMMPPITPVTTTVLLKQVIPVASRQSIFVGIALPLGVPVGVALPELLTDAVGEIVGEMPILSSELLGVGTATADTEILDDGEKLGCPLGVLLEEGETVRGQHCGGMSV